MIVRIRDVVQKKNGGFCMEFVDYKTKSQKVSSLLQQAKCPEDLLNCKEIELENDFQYICINSGVNTQVVGGIIAILAQNGNKL